MKKMTQLFTLMMMLLVGVFASAASFEGKWKTIDDETHKVKSIVELSIVNGELVGKIIEIFPAPEDPKNPMCDKCPDAFKGKPVLGLQFLWGLKPDGDQWKNGEVLDPKNGKVYSCKMKLIEGGQKLEIRGYIGFSLLGRSQTWERVP